VNLAYSLILKRQVIVDVILLAGLYTSRIIAGAAAITVIPSFWLLAFSMFIFLSLATAKRCSEMAGNPLATQIAGRGYLHSDLPVLLSLGSASGMVAVLVLALYIDAAATPEMYPGWQVLWLVPPIVLYWITRIWMKCFRGELHDDPVVFAAKDWQSLVILGCVAVLFVTAMLSPEWW
jgi:4-hydroxybenzoate polyprenyltransferase